jgi:two-component system nitrogen regulation sensor histidine kinase NtrY
MKNLKVILGFLLFSIVGVLVTGIVLNYFGIEHGSLLIKAGIIFIAVNIVLYLLILVISVFRNLLSVYIEKKQKAIGSKFRTTLVLSFLGLVFIPSVLLFILSNQLINNSIDTWFSLEVQKPIYDSMDVAKVLYLKEKEHVKNYAALLASNDDFINNTIQLETGKKNFRGYLVNKTDGSALINNAFKGSMDSAVISLPDGDLIKAASPVRRNNRIIGVVVVETIIAREVVNKMESIQKSFNDFAQIQAQQHPIRFIYFSMLTIATLLIIFIALWASLRIAKSITVPIQSLAEATRTVAHGDLDFRIHLQRDDEIGLLINSFNKMLDDIQKGKSSLEVAYKESDRRRLSMEFILQSINTGVMFFDRSGRIMTINDAACTMLNIDRNNFKEKTHKDLMIKLKSNELSDMVKRLSEKGFGAIKKEIHIYINGRPMDLSVYMTILMDADDKFIGTLVVFDNLTEVIMAQRALAWQEVAKRIAHEIKNPLTPIRLSAERLMKKWTDNAPDLGEVIERATRTIVQEVNSLRSLVDEFSRFGKMPKINLAPTNIRTVIEEVADLYSNVKGIEIIPSWNSDLPEIEIDKQQIKMALINLMDNAIQAETAKIWINLHYDSSLDLIKIEVADDGTGIREDDKDKLFFPYFSTKKEGTGLGLAIVNSIISKHRGYIRVQDNKPKGSQFIIELPLGQH